MEKEKMSALNYEDWRVQSNQAFAWRLSEAKSKRREAWQKIAELREELNRLRREEIVKELPQRPSVSKEAYNEYLEGVRKDAQERGYEWVEPEQEVEK